MTATKLKIAYNSAQFTTKTDELRELTLPRVKELIQAKMLSTEKVYYVWEMQGFFFGYQIEDKPYSNSCVIIDGEAILRD